MYRLLLLIGGLAFLFAAAVIHTGLETGDIRPADAAVDPEKGNSAVARVFYLLVVGGIFFTGLAIKETFFASGGNQASRRKRRKDRERGVIRR